MPPVRATSILLALATLAALGPGCEPYRIEYRRRPAYYARMMDGPAPDRVVLDDGTVVLYNASEATKKMSAEAITRAAKRDADADVFRIRDEQEDGSVVLRALLPEHVIANTLTCLRTQEYDLIWEQLLAEDTKLAYTAEGQGKAEFTAFFLKNRIPLAKTLNRMRIGFATYETVVSKQPGGIIECSFWPQVAKQMQFKKVRIIRENFGLKLLIIE
jgi:hypothetical protein